VLLFVGDRSGVQWLAVAGLVLFIPFLAYLYSILRTAEGQQGWLAPTALAAGLCGITLKLVSDVPERALRHLQAGTPLEKTVRDVADGAFVIALTPLAVFTAAVAAIAIQTGALPRWLGASAALTSVALGINGAFYDANFGPAFLLLLAWTFTTSIVLVRATPAPSETRAHAYAR
jgi:hypothetical protein